MRSGSNWVATDYFQHQSQCFEFTATRVTNTRQVKISWAMYTACDDNAASPTYYLCYKNQKLTVNGSSKVNWTSTSNPYYKTSSGTTVYYGFTDKNSWLDKNYRNQIFYDTNGDYTGIRRYVKVLGTNWESGSFTLTANAAGSVSFSVSGSFGWYGKTGLDFSKTFTITDLVPPQTYTITYKPNNKSFAKGNSVTNLPSDGTKTYDVPTTLSKRIPKSYDDKKDTNYTWVAWAKNVSDSFHGSDFFAAGVGYSANADLTLYAVWAPVEKTVTFNFNDADVLGRNTEVPVVKKYQDPITTFSAADVTKYGYTLVGWKSREYNRTLSPNETFLCIGDETLEAIWEPNTYLIHLMDKDGKELPSRAISATYNTILYGNFIYEVSGYNVLGWALKQLPIRNPGDPQLPIIPNEPYYNSSAYDEDALFIKAGDFTSTPCYISDSIPRKYLIGKEIALYPVLEYSTSMYLYLNGAWRLVMPYIYKDGRWHQSLGYMYKDGAWRL